MNSKEKIKKKPSIRFKNTDCPFSIVLKFKRAETVPYNCVLELEWTHNHPVNSLQSLSFKDIPDHVKKQIFSYFEKGYTPGLAYREFLSKLRLECTGELELHKMMSDRSVFPRRTDYNALYTEYCKEKYGTRNTSTIFEKLKGI